MYADTTVTAIFQPSTTLLEDGDVAFCAALVTLTQGRTMIHVNNFTDHPYTLRRGSHVAHRILYMLLLGKLIFVISLFSLQTN